MRKMTRGREAGVAGADHDDVSAGRQRRAFRRALAGKAWTDVLRKSRRPAGRQRIPPVGVLVHGRAFAIGTAAAAENRAALALLDERHELQVLALPVGRERNLGVRDCGSGVADRRHVADHRRVREHTAAVLTALHVRLQAILRDRDNDVGVITFGHRRQVADLHRDDHRGRRLRVDRRANRAVRCVRRLLQCPASGCRVASHEFLTAVDDHLRRVDAVAAEPCGIGRAADRSAPRTRSDPSSRGDPSSPRAGRDR